MFTIKRQCSAQEPYGKFKGQGHSSRKYFKSKLPKEALLDHIFLIFFLWLILVVLNNFHIRTFLYQTFRTNSSTFTIVTGVSWMLLESVSVTFYFSCCKNDGCNVTLEILLEYSVQNLIDLPKIFLKESREHSLYHINTINYLSIFFLKLSVWFKIHITQKISKP